EPLDPIHFAVMLRGVAVSKLQEIKSDNLKHTRRDSFPLRHVGVLDGIDACDDRAGQAGLFSRLTLGCSLRRFTGLNKALWKSPGFSIAGLNQGHLRR